MDRHITLREAITPEDIARHRAEMDAMILRDTRPNCDIGAPMTAEEARRFTSPRYHSIIDSFCERDSNPGRRFFFDLDGQEIGFVLYCIYHTEDQKCFIVSFCIYPDYRCQGLGSACFEILQVKATADGASYFELNTHCRRARQFWERLGFRINGCDEHGDLLLCRPPEDELPITVEKVNDPGDPDLRWQLFRLENSFLQEIGEEILDDAKKERLIAAAKEKRIRFFFAKRGYRAVGMCSVSCCYSTFACGDIGVFDDFYIEPIYRRKGIARQLTSAVQNWCKANKLASLTVGCSPGDVDMYRSLGFDISIGTTLACPLSE